MAAYPVETVATAIAGVLHMELAGARLVAVWLLKGLHDYEAPPLTDVQVGAILARVRDRLV